MPLTKPTLSLGTAGRETIPRPYRTSEHGRNAFRAALRREGLPALLAAWGQSRWAVAQRPDSRASRRVPMPLDTAVNWRAWPHFTRGGNGIGRQRASLLGPEENSSRTRPSSGWSRSGGE